jgi:hypothetical protein
MVSLRSVLTHVQRSNRRTVSGRSSTMRQPKARMRPDRCRLNSSFSAANSTNAAFKFSGRPQAPMATLPRSYLTCRVPERALVAAASPTRKPPWLAGGFGLGVEPTYTADARYGAVDPLRTTALRDLILAGQGCGDLSMPCALSQNIGSISIRLDRTVVSGAVD